MHKKVEPDVLSIALAEPSRRALLENLRFGQKTVTELVQATQLKQPNVSNHLAKMRQQGIVRAERIGRQVYYSLSMPFADVLLRMHEFASNPGVMIDHEPSVAASLAPVLGSSVESRHADPRNGTSRGDEVGQENSPATTLFEWQTTYFQSILRGKEDQATHLVNGMLAQGLKMETIYVDIFEWALYRVGDLFQQGATDEAHEHMASAITERMMARVAQFHVPVIRIQYRAVLGCVAGNWHVLGLRMLADGLRGLGWDTVFLGANVPTTSFLSLVQLMRPDLVVISCAIEEQLHELHELIARLRRMRQHTDQSFVIAAGGQYLRSHATMLPSLHADLYAPDLPHFLGQVNAHFTPAK